MNKPQTLFSISQFVEDEPAFNEGGLRWMIFNENSNRMKEAGAFPKVGGTRLIHKEIFLTRKKQRMQS